MRLKMWAAVAAAFVCAGQVQAARYLTIQVTGSAVLPGYGVTLNNENPNNPVRGVYSLVYTSVDTYVFDTFASQIDPFGGSRNAASGVIPQILGPYDAANGRSGFYSNTSSYSAQLYSAAGSSITNISILDLPAGPVYSFNFDLNNVALSTTLQPLLTSQSPYSYIVRADPRYSDTVRSLPGQITSILARTTDVIPASLGATEQLFVSVLPEPASWLTMILGMGMIGGLLRRRHKVGTAVKIA